MKPDVMLKVEGLSAGYGKRVVLHGLDLELRDGEVVVVVGPNGVGKSTLLRAIMGLAKVFEGKVWFQGDQSLVEITRMPVFQRVKMGLGYMMQQDNVFPGLSVEENLSLASGGRDGERGKKNIGEVMEILPELREMKDVRAGLLSGGQRQILALGMVLVQKPRMMLLDEPTAGVGGEIVARIYQVLREHLRTGLMVTHEGLEFWRDRARIVRMKVEK